MWTTPNSSPRTGCSLIFRYVRGEAPERVCVYVCVCVCVCLEERGAAFKGKWTQSLGLLSKLCFLSVVEVVTENRQSEDEEVD